MTKLFHKDGDHHHSPIIPPKKALKFEDFLNFFPPIDLPVTLSTDTERQIADVHDPLNSSWISRFILEDNQIDEYTEFLPCFRIPDTQNFFAIVYWQASLEGNAYFLTTFSKGGDVLDHKLIAGSLYLQDAMKQLVCTIDKSWTITRVEGTLKANGEIDDREERKETFMQITLDGEVVED